MRPEGRILFFLTLQMNSMSSLSMSLTTSTFILDRKCRAISFTASLCRREGEEEVGEGEEGRGKKKWGGPERR